MTIKLTKKQVEILKIIKNKRSDGEFCDIYDLMHNLSYIVKRDALLHSIKILVKNGYVERLPKIKRLGYKSPVTTFNITSIGYSVV